MSARGGDVLLTGTTGFVGMELLTRYLERSDRRIVTLVRAANDEAATARVHAVLENLYGVRAARHRSRIDSFAADLTAPHLGLDAQLRDRLACRVSTIVHSAASVSFAMPLAQARAINVEGTQRMLEFAEAARSCGGLRRYAHVSTAYVSGTHAGRFAECDLDLGQAFNNSYEQSKFEAEQLVRSHPDLPSTILRPSIVVGDHRNGWTSAFNVLYWPLRAFARGLFTAVPAIPTAPVDVVPVDFVADAIHALAEADGGVGETYHLTAGPNASTIAEIAQLASGYFRRPLPRVVPPAEFSAVGCSAAEVSALDAGREYFPYFSIGTVFDQAATAARLEPLGIRVTPLREYMERLLDFATRSRWGKRPITRVDAFAT